jgi:hypothetical protein
MVPDTVNAAKVGLAVVLRSCGVPIVMVLPLAVAVTPLDPANVSVLPVLTLPVPVVPDRVIVLLGILMLAEPSVVTRPYMSVVITGMLVDPPTVVAPGPVGVKLMTLLLTVTFPLPELTILPDHPAPLDQ